MTIANLDTVWVTASVPETDTHARFQGPAGRSRASPLIRAKGVKGKVLFVSDVVDPDTRRTKVRIAFDNPGTRLRPGMFANVSFFAPAQRVAVVPASALVLKDDLIRCLSRPRRGRSRRAPSISAFSRAMRSL